MNLSAEEKTSLTDDERIENVVPLPPPEHLIRFFRSRARRWKASSPKRAAACAISSMGGPTA